MAKLVLDIEPEVINGLTKFAEEEHVSVSELVEKLYIVASKTPNKIKRLKRPEDFSPWLQSLVLAKEPTPDFNHKIEYGKHLEEKYGL